MSDDNHTEGCPLRNNVEDTTDIDMVWRYVCPILLLLGSVTGVLNIVVLTRKNSRQSSTAVFLLALAVADLVVLHTGLTRQWILHSFKIDIRKQSEFWCKSHIFIVYFALQMSSWCLVLVTVERLVVVQFPHRAKFLSTRKRALVAIFVTFSMLLCLNVHTFIGNRIEFIHIDNSTSLSVCSAVSKDYFLFVKDAWAWVDLLLFCGLPSAIMLVANAVIISNLYHSHRNRRTIFPLQSARAISRRRSITNAPKTWTSMVAFLLLLDAWFIVCTVPVSVILLIAVMRCNSFESRRDFEVAWAISSILMYSNNTLNFFFYCISGSRFRQELKDLFCKPNLKSNNETVVNSKLNTYRATFDKKQVKIVETDYKTGTQATKF